LRVARHLQYIDEAFVGPRIFPADPRSHAVHRFYAEYADAKVCRLRRWRIWDVAVALAELEECGSRGQMSDSGGGAAAHVGVTPTASFRSAE
jgi:hypothetical protein